MKTITLEISDDIYELLEVLTEPPVAPATVEDVVLQLIDHAQQGVYRPASWERDWLVNAFGHDWIEFLEPDPTRKSVDGRVIFDRPKNRRP